MDNFTVSDILFVHQSVFSVTPYLFAALGVKVVVHVTLLVVGLQNAGQLSIPSHVESSISGQNNQPSAAIPPTYFVLNNSICFSKNQTHENTIHCLFSPS